MLASRYVRWLERRWKSVLIAAALLVGTSAYLAAFHLPLQSDFSNLLPEDAPAVRDADRLARRLPVQDTMLMLIVAPDAASRAQVAERAAARLRALPADLITRIEDDDADTRAFVRAHAHLFTPLADLEAARDALAERLRTEKLRANPAYIDLDDEAAARPDQLAELRARRAAAEARLARSANVSADGRSHVIVIRTAFRATDVERDLRLVAELDRLQADLHASHPTVAVGYAGGPVVTVAEHRALTKGMVISSAITMLLVVLVLWLHLRSLRLLVLLSVNIVAATILAFGLAALSVGHLNAATAFLGAIIAGNGVNYGILLVARYLEERATTPEPREALARAIAGTLRPTLVASLGAAVAYGALIATEFRGFADFALIGGLGMLACWVASFTLLPVLVLRFAPAAARGTSPLFGALVVRLFGFRRPVLVCAAVAAVTLASGVIAWRYLADDPYEYDLTALRSQAPDAVEARRWMQVSDDTFGKGLAGLAGQTFVAVEREDQVPQVVDALARLRVQQPIVGAVRSILDVVPRDQEPRLAVLAELRRLIDEALLGELDDRDRAELLAHRPPDELRAITARDLPAGIAARLTERDGRVGHIVAVRPGDSFDERDGRDLIRFADAVRQLRLDSGETVSTAGASVLFADVLLQIREDGPRVTALAIAGLVVVVVLVVGRTRRSAAVLLATGAGSLAMIAACAVAGLRIHFLDFVALPITLGLGVDYAINLADRATHSDPLHALRTTGGTVLVCSLTTIIGYASLFASDNLAIQGFGFASLIGEVTCVIAALVLVPSMLAVRLPTLSNASAPGRGLTPSAQSVRGLTAGTPLALPHDK